MGPVNAAWTELPGREVAWEIAGFAPQGPLADARAMTSGTAPLVRPATAADGPRFLDLVRGLAAYERLPPPDEAACARLLDDAFGPAPRFELFVAELDGEVVAYAATFTAYSTFLARPTLFLEDLFVDPAARRRGVATAVLAHLEAQARARGCGRFEWYVLNWNVDAQALYQGIGATLMPEWRVVRKTL